MDIDIGGQPLQMRLDFAAATAAAEARNVPLPEPVTPLVQEWRRLRAIVTSPDRPCETQLLKQQTAARLRAAEDEQRHYERCRRMVPADYAFMVDDECERAAARRAALVDELAALERGTHPETIRLAQWEAAYPDVDMQYEIAEMQLDAALREWADGPGRAWMPELTPGVSPVGKRMWREAVATQLTYREHYGIPVDDPAPLGAAKAWDPVQRDQREQVGLLLADVGVEVDPPDVTVQLRGVEAPDLIVQIPQLEIGMPYPSPYSPGGSAIA